MHNKWIKYYNKNIKIDSPHIFFREDFDQMCVTTSARNNLFIQHHTAIIVKLEEQFVRKTFVIIVKSNISIPAVWLK